MKKIYLIIVLLIFASSNSFAQTKTQKQSKKAVVKKNIVYKKKPIVKSNKINVEPVKTNKEKELEARIKELEKEKNSLKNHFKIGETVCTFQFWEEGIFGEYTCEIVGTIMSVSEVDYDVRIEYFKLGNCSRHAWIERANEIEQKVYPGKIYTFKNRDTWNNYDGCK